MNVDELEEFIQAVAGTDRRTTGRYDVRMWGLIAHRSRWTFEAAIEALMQWRMEHPGEWVEPGHIEQIIRAARRKAAASFVAPRVPGDLADKDYLAWYREQIAAHVDRVMAAWANGEPIPPAMVPPIETQARLELVSGAPEHLRPHIETFLQRIGRDRDPKPRPAAVPRPQRLMDLERRCEAHAELDAIRAEVEQAEQIRQEQEGSPV